MNYDLIRPCPHCPFRIDGEGYLRPERAQEIATSLAQGAEFACHQTTEDDPHDESERIAVEKSQFCAGALIALEKSGVANQAMRIAERLNIYNPSKLDMDAPVGTLLDFQARHTGDEPESDPCHVSGYDCEAPAGYLEDGVVVRNVVEIEIGQCDECYEPTCENCGELRGERFLCNECLEYEDE